MKTAVIMERKLFSGVVRQNHKTGMLNANDLHKIGNAMRKGAELSPKQMGAYFMTDSADELIREICLVENIGIDEVKTSKKGKFGGTWVSPVLFVDMAMWYSPQLKVQIIKWVIDGLLDARDNSGESYKRMASALKQNFSNEFSPIKMIEVANTIAAECKVGIGKDKWQTATEKQLKKRERIQDTVSIISDLCPNIGVALNKSINKVNRQLIEV
ncbi:MAG: KilA-N domain-containing protein [Alteromonadales bacterium]|nr:KilA-N domain-containing protein [Alteromonadales bacterium]